MTVLITWYRNRYIKLIRGHIITILMIQKRLRITFQLQNISYFAKSWIREVSPFPAAGEYSTRKNEVPSINRIDRFPAMFPRNLEN